MWIWKKCQRLMLICLQEYLNEVLNKFVNTLSKVNGFFIKLIVDVGKTLA
jgi:hypothetical protein